MHNKAMQGQLRTEPEGTAEEVLQFAVAFEQGLKRQVCYEECKFDVKYETTSVCAKTNTGKVRFRCGPRTSHHKNFTN